MHIMPFSRTIVLLLVVILSCPLSLSAIEAAGKIPSLIALGDSILDTGNNNNLRTFSKCNFWPYGRDFPGGKPTGRFGNGKIPSDLIAEGLGIKELLPAYSDPNLQNKDLLTGVSFASGGAGLDHITSDIQSVKWVRTQLNEFKVYKKKLNDIVGDQEKAKDIISNALFLISAGNNDIAITYFSTATRVIQYDVAGYTDLLVNWSSTFFKDLHDMGARKFAVLGTLPLGCLPGARSTVGGYLKLCADYVNDAAEMFNTKLSAEVKKLNAKLPDAKFVYVDMYTPLMNLIQNPQKSGFYVAADPCCCTVATPIPCLDASWYVFWDYGHPTQKSYTIILSPIIKQLKKAFT